MLLDHRFDVEQSQTVTLDIMHISSGHAIELVVDVRQLVGRDTHAVVGHTDGCRCGRNLDMCLAGGILDGIVDEVVQDVAQVGAVSLYGQVIGLDMRSDGDRLIGLQLLLLDDGLQQNCRRRSMLIDRICSTMPLSRSSC